MSPEIQYYLQILDQNKYNLNFLLEYSKIKSPIGVNIRNIDLIIHRWGVTNDDIEYNIPDFLEHQKNIISLSEDNELQLFNSNTVYNGLTGPMTDILRACYFQVYSYLLDKNVPINTNKHLDSGNDLQIFISLLFSIKYDVIEDKLLIPQSELDAIKKIIPKFKQLNKNNFEFDNEWWNNLKHTIINTYDVVLPQWYFWNTNPHMQSSSLIWDRIKQHVKLYNGIWETRPYYMIAYQDNFDLNKENTLKRIEYLHTLFRCSE